MYAKSTRPSAKREVQKERSAKRDDRIARSNLRAKRAAREERDENVSAKRADFLKIFCSVKLLLRSNKTELSTFL